MIIQEEAKMLSILDDAKRILLIEPKIRRKYPPLGLAKIATYLKRQGKKVYFLRGLPAKPLRADRIDLVCVTSLFTYSSMALHGTIAYLDRTIPDIPVLAGGIYASLRPKELQKAEPRINVFQGYSKTLDKCVPNYSIDWNLEEPWNQFSFLFTSRGCPNRCAYCAVWRIENKQWINPTWKDHIVDDKPYVMISDNNLSACPIDHIKEVIAFLEEKKKKVVFDNGFDCKHITKELASLLSGLKFARSGMRMAFDRIEEDGIFQKAVNRLIKAGVKPSDIMAYVIYNFKDKPQEANYRMLECVRLKIRPYPQQYQPLNSFDFDDTYIGKYWTLNLTKAFRYFWLMAGFYTKMTFDEFIKSDKCKIKLSKEDIEAWKNPM